MGKLLVVPALMLARPALAAEDVEPIAPSDELATPQRDTGVRDQGTAVEAPRPSFRQLSLEINPLALFIGRYSVNVEYLPAVHHAVVLNPHYDSVSAGVTFTDPTTNEQTKVEDHYTGFGAEIGYRYYTGRSGPNGLFVGPSFLIGRYTADATYFPEEKSFTNIGWAVDIGGQGVIGPGIVLGGGFGIQQTKNSLNADDLGDLPVAAEVIVGSGLRPRFLFSAGYAF